MKPSIPLMKGNLVISNKITEVFLDLTSKQSYSQESTLNIHLQHYENMYAYDYPLQHCF